ncbi:MAG: 2-oxoacid:acceptor oxidoreductase subunit alpha [Firmicutes bacterium]|nr:2-oxoacid:acceptor oxidoreductase subunit alpha [Bacillota bacterium]
MSSELIKFGQGNEACAEGAFKAGARFYAGYPITPSSEIAEIASRRLPQLGGIYLQMEDELGSMAAIIGASASGVKSFTATSGPGFSLMQENLGVAIIGEVPCVVIDVQRSGPSTGLATKPAQADIMQARWGTHGDHAIVVLYPSTVQECFDLTVEAFNIAEMLRSPVILLTDEVVGHMREKFIIRDQVKVIDRKKPTGPVEKYLPYQPDEDGIPPMAAFGDKYRMRITSSTHGPDGFTNSNPVNARQMIERLYKKIMDRADEITYIKEYMVDDADILIVACGYTARVAKAAVKQLRNEGIKAGLFHPLTIWPFPEKQLKKAALDAEKILVPEMNLGQLVYEVERILKEKEVFGLHKSNGQPLFVREIVDKVKEVAK